MFYLVLFGCLVLALGTYFNKQYFLKGHKLKKNGKPHPYIFKWYASAYIILAIIVTYLEYDNWFS